MIYIYYYYYIKNNALLLFTYRCFYTHMQRFFNIVLLEKCRDDIRANKKLNYHLYMALKKSLFKVELRCRIIVMIHHFIYFVPSYLSTYHIISRYLLISSPTCYTSHGTCCALLWPPFHLLSHFIHLYISLPPSSKASFSRWLNLERVPWERQLLSGASWRR